MEAFLESNEQNSAYYHAVFYQQIHMAAAQGILPDSP